MRSRCSHSQWSDACPLCSTGQGERGEAAYQRGVRDTVARLSAGIVWQSCTRLGCGTTYSDGSARYCTDCVKEMMAKTESRFAKLKEAAEEAIQYHPRFAFEQARSLNNLASALHEMKEPQ